MAGILDPGMLGEQGGGGLFGNLFAPIANNQNAILGYLAGALQGGGLGESIGRGLQGWVGGSQTDQARGAQLAAMKYIANAPDMDPSLKSALVQNPALAMKYMEGLAKPGEFKTAGRLYGSYTPSGGFKIQGAAPVFKTVDPSQTMGYYTPPIPGGRTSPGVPGAVAPVQSGGPKFEDAERNRINPADIMPQFQQLPDAAAAAPPGPRPAPNQKAIDYLMANPGTAEQFDMMFGVGAAAKVLGVR